MLVYYTFKTQNMTINSKLRMIEVVMGTYTLKFPRSIVKSPGKLPKPNFSINGHKKAKTSIRIPPRIKIPDTP